MMGVKRPVSIALLAFLALSLMAYASGETPTTGGLFAGPTSTPGTTDQRIATLEAEVADLQQRVRIAEGNIGASYSPADALPAPLTVGTDVVFVQDYPHGAYITDTGAASGKFFTLACGTYFPTEDSAAQAALMGYGNPVAWFTCGWVPYLP